MDAVAALSALSAYRLTPRQQRDSVDAARAQAAAEKRPVTAGDLRRGARLHHVADLEHLARRVEPSASWDDLVLGEAALRQLAELACRYRHRDTVLADWGLRPAHGRAGKVTAMFTGESGTGKTLAAEVLAGEAGIDLYVINLATVVDKYVGETEKNLERIFTAAAGVQGMLFFDEADALFGKRSKVSDARDRFANIETAYLLQRLETFDGLVVLATNLLRQRGPGVPAAPRCDHAVSPAVSGRAGPAVGSVPGPVVPRAAGWILTGWRQRSR